MIRTYSELISYSSFLDRYHYLKLSSNIGLETFGFDRWLNQTFYRSAEWKSVRREVILRDSDGDNALDLGCDGFKIPGRVLIHHMNPISKLDIVDRSDILLNPEYLICCSHKTHNAIHFGNESLLAVDFVERSPNDTCPWKA